MAQKIYKTAAGINIINKNYMPQKEGRKETKTDKERNLHTL